MLLHYIIERLFIETSGGRNDTLKLHPPALLGTAGGRRVGALQGYEGGRGRMAGEGTGATLGGGGGRADGQVGVKKAGRGGGGGGGGPSGLSRRMGNLDGSERTGEGGGG